MSFTDAMPLSTITGRRQRRRLARRHCCCTRPRHQGRQRAWCTAIDDQRVRPPRRFSTCVGTMSSGAAPIRRGSPGSPGTLAPLSVGCDGRRRRGPLRCRPLAAIPGPPAHHRLAYVSDRLRLPRRLGDDVIAASDLGCLRRVVTIGEALTADLATWAADALANRPPALLAGGRREFPGGLRTGSRLGRTGCVVTSRGGRRVSPSSQPTAGSLARSQRPTPSVRPPASRSTGTNVPTRSSHAGGRARARTAPATCDEGRARDWWHERARPD